MLDWILHHYGYKAWEMAYESLTVSEQFTYWIPKKLK